MLPDATKETQTDRLPYWLQIVGAAILIGAAALTARIIWEQTGMDLAARSADGGIFPGTWLWCNSALLSNPTHRLDGSDARVGRPEQDKEA